MSVARARALTQGFGVTSVKIAVVEMSVARARALTHTILIKKIAIAAVEMSVARARALTHFSTFSTNHGRIRRNECCPCEGIDTGCQN